MNDVWDLLLQSSGEEAGGAGAAAAVSDWGAFAGVT